MFYSLYAASALPNTGVAIGGVIIAAIVLVGGGIALSIMARKKRVAKAAESPSTESSTPTTDK